MENEKRTRFIDVRKRNGLSQGDVAKRLNVSQRKISDFETGTSHTDEIKFLRGYMSLFNVSADYLLGITDDEQEKPDFDDVACADYMGMSHKTIKFFRHATRPDDKDISEHERFIKTVVGADNLPDNYASNELKRPGFALDCFFSYMSECDDEHFFDFLYDMILEYYHKNRDNAAFSDSRHKIDGVPSRSWDLQFDRSYRTGFIDIERVLADFVENLDYELLRDFARDYDLRNNSNVYAELFGADSVM